MTTTCSVREVSADETVGGAAGGAAACAIDVEMRVETTAAKQSTLAAALPIFEPLNSFAFPSGDALDALSPRSSRVRLRTTYLSRSLRISPAARPAGRAARRAERRGGLRVRAGLDSKTEKSDCGVLVNDDSTCSHVHNCIFIVLVVSLSQCTRKKPRNRRSRCYSRFRAEGRAAARGPRRGASFFSLLSDSGFHYATTYIQ